MYADVFWDLKIYIFLRRSLAHISYIIIHDLFFCRYIWGSCPPIAKCWLYAILAVVFIVKWFVGVRIVCFKFPAWSGDHNFVSWLANVHTCTRKSGEVSGIFPSRIFLQVLCPCESRGRLGSASYVLGLVWQESSICKHNLLSTASKLRWRDGIYCCSCSLQSSLLDAWNLQWYDHLGREHIIHTAAVCDINLTCGFDSEITVWVRCWENE